MPLPATSYKFCHLHTRFRGLDFKQKEHFLRKTPVIENSRQRLERVEEMTTRFESNQEEN